MSRYLVSALALAAAIIPSVSFAGSGDASVSLRISGFVPVICRAQLQSATVALPDDGSSVDLGRLNEFCNAPGGYRVVVSYTSNRGEGNLGSFYLDGERVQLSNSGSVVLVRSNGPSIQNRQLTYQPGKSAITSMQVTVVPQGV